MCLQVEQGRICSLVGYLVREGRVGIVLKFLVLSPGLGSFVYAGLSLFVVELTALSGRESCVAQLPDVLGFVLVVLFDDILVIITSCHASMKPNY